MVDHPFTAAAGNGDLEMVEIFRQTVVAELLRGAHRLGLLIFIISHRRDRVMDIVNLCHQVCDRQLDLVQP